MQDTVRAVGRWFADVPAGRRSKWVVLAVWIVILIVIGPLAGKFEDAQENDPADYLPANAESVEAINELEDFPSGDISDAITVFNRDGGLDARPTAAIEETKAAINADRREGVGETGPPIYSEDGSSALLITPITVEDGTNEAGELLVDATDDIKADARGPARGLEAKVTGPAGFSADAIDVFDSINGTLLYATALLVLVLLIIIYRSPIFWLIPFFSVILAELDLARCGLPARRGRGDRDRPVGRDPAGARLRRRHRLRACCSSRATARSCARHEDKHDAVRIAMRKAGPAIVASGLTVMAALLTLVARRGHRHRRPRPDRRARRRPRDGLDADHPPGAARDHRAPGVLAVHPRVGSEGIDETHGLWSRIAAWVGRGPRRVWIGTTALLLVLCLGLTQLNSDLTCGNGFRDDVDSAEGQELIEESFPAGANAPTNIVVTDEAELDAVRDGGRAAPGRRRGQPRGGAGPDGVKLEATLEEDPLSTAGFDLVPGIRDSGAWRRRDGVLVGGPDGGGVRPAPVGGARQPADRPDRARASCC